MVTATTQRISAGPQDNHASTESRARNGHITAALERHSPQVPDGGYTDGIGTVDANQAVPQDDVISELHHLRRRLETLPVIEQSKGILIGRYGIDAEAAFNILRRLACDHNIKLRDLSQQIVTAATTSGHPGPRPALNDLLRNTALGADPAR
jgi:hypothetical protein